MAITRGFFWNKNSPKALEDMSEEEFNQYYTKEKRTSDRLFKLRGINEQSNSGASKNSNSSSNSSLGSFLGDNFTLDSATDRAKDLAKFRLGLDKEQAEFSGTLREKEAQNNFGRQTSFEKQQQEGRESLTNLTQNALTGRLEKELANRLTQQDRNINQQNLATNRAINLASRRLGQ